MNITVATLAILKLVVLFITKHAPGAKEPNSEGYLDYEPWSGLNQGFIEWGEGRLIQVDSYFSANLKYDGEYYRGYIEIPHYQTYGEDRPLPNDVMDVGGDAMRVIHFKAKNMQHALTVAWWQGLTLRHQVLGF